MSIWETVHGGDMGVYDRSLIVLSAVRGGWVPIMETDPGTSSCCSPAEQSQAHTRKGPVLHAGSQDASRGGRHHPIGFIQRIKKLLLFFLR